MKRGLKYTIAIAALLIVAYNSVYFKKLDEVKKKTSKSFNAKSFATDYHKAKLTPALNNAVEVNQLINLIQTDKENAFDKYSHALGIGNIRYFLIKGEGQITTINENDVALVTRTDSTQRVFTITTEFIYGNAIRDASGLININEFANTMDFNNVSEEVNNIIRTEVIPPFKASVKKGDKVQFYGAIELNRKHPDVNKIEIVPVSLKLLK